MAKKDELEFEGGVEGAAKVNNGEKLKPCKPLWTR